MPCTEKYRPQIEPSDGIVSDCGSQSKAHPGRDDLVLTRTLTCLAFCSSPAAAPKYLAYVQWFTPFQDPKPDHLLYQVKRSLKNGARLASIVPVANIHRSVHLFPVFGRQVPDDWTSDNVLEKCSSFYVNTFSDRHMYHLVV